MQKGLEFEEKDIGRDPQARDELIKRNIQGVPALMINGEMVVGFDKARIDELLKFKIIACENCSAKLRVPSDKGNILVTCSSCSHKFKAES